MVNNTILIESDRNLTVLTGWLPRSLRPYLLTCPMAVLIVTRGPSSCLSTYGVKTSSSSTMGSVSASPVSTDLEHLFRKIWAVSEQNLWEQMPFLPLNLRKSSLDMKYLSLLNTYLNTPEPPAADSFSQCILPSSSHIGDVPIQGTRHWTTPTYQHTSDHQSYMSIWAVSSLSNQSPTQSTRMTPSTWTVYFLIFPSNLYDHFHCHFIVKYCWLCAITLNCLIIYPLHTSVETNLWRYNCFYYFYMHRNNLQITCTSYLFNSFVCFKVFFKTLYFICVC